MRSVLYAVCAAMVVLLATTGCTRQQADPKYTYQQASDLVEQHLHDAVTHLTPAPRLEFDNRVPAPCDGWSNVHPSDLYMIEHTYWLRDVDPAHNDDIFDQLTAYWATNHYVLRINESPQPIRNSRVIVARGPDGFNIGLTQSAGTRDLSLSSQSPCVYLPDPIGEMRQPASTGSANIPSAPAS